MRKALVCILIVFLFSACEFFDNNDYDFLRKLDAEIAWANAERLTVSLEYPGSWGQGAIETTAADRRLGYDFDVEFNPMQGFSIAQWRAYKTADMQAYRNNQEGNWNWVQMANPADELLKMEETVSALEWGKDKDIELSFSPQSGRGVFKIKINIKDAVTIVPLCNNAPEIMRTYPPMTAELNYYRPTETIIVDLSSVVVPETVRFEQGNIEITAWHLDAGEPAGTAIDLTDSDYFTVRWNSGLWRIIIEPTLDGASQIENMQITVTLGPEIKNNLGYSLVGINNENDRINFSWKTSMLSSVSVTKLEAGYDEDKGNITVIWELSSAHPARVSYIVNNSFRSTLASSSGMELAHGSVEIENVLPLNANGVRNGQAVSNIQRYDIWVQLYDTDDEVYRDSGSPIIIWNFNGMTVSRANPAIEISNNGQMELISSNPGSNFLLTRDITLTNHVPIGDRNNPFTGNFYGNGHTITINSMSDSAYMGLFGTVRRYCPGFDCEI